MQSHNLQAFDVDYTYHFTKKLETFKTNDKLGYRTAGSDAEHQTGAMIAEEMKHIGLTEITKDAFTLDTWEFKKAELTFTIANGQPYTAILGSYQTHFVTNGPETYDIIYGGRGTATDFATIDATNKLVLLDIDQERDWWISYPALQAHFKGAIAIIAVQTGGFSQVNADALNAQDICGPAYAPAFSMSQSDSLLLREQLATAASVSVSFDACSIVQPNGTSYNYHGKIEGKEKDSYILISAHYDSYFSGFQDDHAAIALMLGLAKNLITTGYRPQKTLIFLALAAEEWGVIDSRYDWSVGAYNQIANIRPDWRGKVFANINFELPAVAHMPADRIRTVYELHTFLAQFVEHIPRSDVYPQGIEVIAPLATTSDDFSFAIGGIPSLRNDFQDSPFIRTHYHSQFDNETTFNPKAMLFHLQLYDSLIKRYDELAVVPLDFSTRLIAMRQTAPVALHPLLDKALEVARTLPPLTKAHNPKLLAIFYFMETHFTKLTWQDEVIFPYEHTLTNCAALTRAIERLQRGDYKGALQYDLHLIDNTWQAYDFDRDVYDHFTNYVCKAAPERLLWGAGRIMGHIDLFDVVQALKTKTADESMEAEIEQLQHALQQQQRLHQTIVEATSQHIKELIQLLKHL